MANNKDVTSGAGTPSVRGPKSASRTAGNSVRSINSSSFIVKQDESIFHSDGSIIHVRASPTSCTESDRASVTQHAQTRSVCRTLLEGLLLKNILSNMRRAKKESQFERRLHETDIIGRFKDKEIEAQYQLYSSRKLNVARGCLAVAMIAFAQIAHMFLAGGGVTVQGFVLLYLPFLFFGLLYLFNSKRYHKHWKVIVALILNLQLFALFIAEYVLIIYNLQDKLVSTVSIVEMKSFVSIVLLMGVSMSIDLILLLPALALGYAMLFILYRISYNGDNDIASEVQFEAFISVTLITFMLLWPMKVLDSKHRRTFELLQKLTSVIDQQRHRLDEYEAHLKFLEFGSEEKEIVDKLLMGDNRLDSCKIAFEDLEFDKLIGHGSFGEVIQGRYLGTKVAVKRLLRHRINEEYIQSFKLEMLLIKELRHPNIVQFIGASWDSYSNICVVTEFMINGDLTNVFGELAEASWTDPKLRMASDIAMGLAYLHGLRPPVVHRDLKSRNVLVSATYGCKIADFGLSRIIDMEETMTVTGSFLWMAPELIRNDKYTVQADMYSFGVVMTELDRLMLPFSDAVDSDGSKITGGKLLHKVGYEGLRPSLSPQCPDVIQKFVARCLSDCPEDRPTAKEAAGVLEDSIRKLLTKMNTTFLADSIGPVMGGGPAGAKRLIEALDAASRSSSPSSSSLHSPSPVLVRTASLPISTQEHKGGESICGKVESESDTVSEDVETVHGAANRTLLKSSSSPTISQMDFSLSDHAPVLPRPPGLLVNTSQVA